MAKLLHELEAYLVFSEPVLNDEVVNPLSEAKLEVYPFDQTRVRAIRISGDVEGSQALEVLRGLLGGSVRWLEVGLRGYGLIDGKREYRPWRRNAYLSLEAFGAITALEPEVRYHAPN